MPVYTPHPEYTARAGQWQQMRDFIEGEQAVHARGEVYLPKLQDEPQSLYAARLARASLYGATERTVEGLVGMMFRSAPEVEVSPATKGMLLDVTKSGESLDKFVALCARELNTTGKVAVLDDYPPMPRAENGSPVALTVAQVEALNIRPHMARYTAEALINWEYGWHNNRTMLTLAVLHERVTLDNPDDPFVPKRIDQWRELRLAEGVYTQQLWRRPAAGGDPVRHEDPIVPTMAGKPLGEIPLRIIGTGKPPLLALCNVNKSHFQTTADLEHGAHQTALPQPWIAGELAKLDPLTGQYSTPVLYIGGGEAWLFGTGTQVGMLEYTGGGLQSLENRLTSKERQMAVLGARMLEAQKSGVEAADTAGMHRAGEQSILQQQAGELSGEIEKALAVFDKWAGGSGQVKYQINKDFLPTRLTAQEVTALVQAWQSGAMSQEEMFGNLQRGGWISEGADYETEQSKIENNPPALPAAPAAAPGSAGDDDDPAS